MPDGHGVRPDSRGDPGQEGVAHPPGGVFQRPSALGGIRGHVRPAHRTRHIPGRAGRGDKLRIGGARPPGASRGRDGRHGVATRRPAPSAPARAAEPASRDLRTRLPPAARRAPLPRRAPPARTRAASSGAYSLPLHYNRQSGRQQWRWRTGRWWRGVASGRNTPRAGCGIRRRHGCNAAARMPYC